MKVNRCIIVPVIVLFLIPIIFTVLASTGQESIKIGVVTTSDDLFNASKVAIEALDGYEGLFYATSVDERFNESEVRIKDGMYLTDDYFDSQFADMVRKEHDIDIVMIMTDKRINNWKGDGKALWGQADTRSSMILVTTVNFRFDPSEHERYIKHTALHEVLHLLGYVHPADDRECVMQYAELHTDLSSDNKAELSSRAMLWRLGQGQDFGSAVLTINFTLSLIYSTPIIATMMLLNFAFKRYRYKKMRMGKAPFILGIGALFIIILLSSALVGSALLRVISLTASLLVFVVIEESAFRSQFKKGVTEKDKGC